MTARPYWLSAPALLLYIAMFLIPMVMTFLLSFYSYDMNQGIVTGFQLTNYAEVLQDSYFHKTFLRKLLMSVLVTVFCVLLGAPEAYILHRMSMPWKSICMLADLNGTSVGQTGYYRLRAPIKLLSLSELAKVEP